MKYPFAHSLPERTIHFKKLVISLDINTIYSISYNDTFDQEVKIFFTNLSWQTLPDEKFTFDMPPKIDIVYH